MTCIVYLLQSLSDGPTMKNDSLELVPEYQSDSNVSGASECGLFSESCEGVQQHFMDHLMGTQSLVSAHCDPSK